MSCHVTSCHVTSCHPGHDTSRYAVTPRYSACHATHVMPPTSLGRSRHATSLGTSSSTTTRRWVDGGLASPRVVPRNRSAGGGVSNEARFCCGAQKPKSSSSSSEMSVTGGEWTCSGRETAGNGRRCCTAEPQSPVDVTERMQTTAYNCRNAAPAAGNCLLAASVRGRSVLTAANWVFLEVCHAVVCQQEEDYAVRSTCDASTVPSKERLQLA